MASRQLHRAIEKCPFCGAAVRRDRLELHAKSVHPGQALDSATLKRLREDPTGPE